MDFFAISTIEKKGVLEAGPDFIVGRSEDLMVRAKNFYAIWDEERGLWSTDEYDVQRLVDEQLREFANKNPHVGRIKYMRSFGAGGQTMFRKFMSQIGDNAHQLDMNLTFKSDKVTKKDYVSKRLPYDLTPGDISAWDKMVGTLYSPAEREKIEWFFGAIISGDSKFLQKFIVLYGPPGAGKGTIIDIALAMFKGYVTTFDAKALGSSNNQFAASAFANNPLVAIQHDGDLSKIDDNTLLNSIVSKEILKVNEKYKPPYDAQIVAALMMGTNKAVKITDAQSGLIRRLIDVHPTGVKLVPSEYHPLKDKILTFELGAIAHHCLQVYKELGPTYYSNYQPLEMMFKTNAFFNFIETYYDVFEKQDGVAAQQAWKLYKEYAEEANLDRTMKNYQFKDELGKYFEHFHERYVLDGVTIRSYYTGFKAEPFKQPVDDKPTIFRLIMEDTASLFDLEMADLPAQYSNDAGTPKQAWLNVRTSLSEIDTSKEHYLKVPENHIVIDFDLKDADGNKSLELNLEAAAKWPATYAELSKSGKGVHLHYTYSGDVLELEREFLPGIEVKVFTGNSSLRRRLSLCNNVSIAPISTGLPIKEKKRVLEPGTMKSDKALRDLIARNLRKEIHPGTKPSIDFIKKILDDAYDDGLKYDVSDMRGAITAFANNSSNKALECLKIVQSMRWKSEEEIEDTKPALARDDRLVIFDIESYQNLFVICWKFKAAPGEKTKPEDVVRMVNPKPHEVEALFSLKLVGFNNRNYDNHMLWAAALGYSVKQLYELSQRIISGAVGSKFGEAYNLSWTDIYDLSTKKQGLKKWQIELGLEHREMDIPWDQPVPQGRVANVVDYCVNDVLSTEEVLNHLDGDYKARLILADLSGLTPNDTTAKHTAAIVFGKTKNFQSSFVHPDLSKEFPGYVFEGGKSTYRGEIVGEGGYVYSEPGVYRNVALLDVASMHPTSIGQLNVFGEYTPNFMALVEAQLAIKRRDYAAAKTMLGGKLTPYLEAIEDLKKTDEAAAFKAASDLRYGLKIAINIVYGLTSAKFDNPFKDFRNTDNVVAKRGALFMIDLKHFIQKRGFKVVHIKTDSAKIPNATPEIIEEVRLFGEKYGYTFEHEADYAKLGLFNDAVYVAKKDECISHCWTATGTQFIPEKNPYVFKKLFGYGDDIDFYDTCETRSVQQGAMYLDFGSHDSEGDYGYVDQAVAWVKKAEKDLKAAEKTYNAGKADGRDAIERYQGDVEDAQEAYREALTKLVHVGRVGRFTPVLPGYGGGQLWRVMDGKHYAVADTKGYLWVDANIALELPAEAVDYGFFEKKLEAARADIQRLVDASDEFETVEEFLS